MNDGRESIIAFYKLCKVACEFRYSTSHRIKKKVSTILNFFIYVSSIYTFLNYYFMN